ncbi:MAG: hypothetical protein J6U10_08220 [Lachnospiraceae bacterium]|nr:hypothetical protein [Lachnospiraceae bacterium]MBP5184263.1 hypothetical protein [Lachnospiraceae bacterium]
MPWCPQCREEYKEGVVVCPDCEVALVETLEKKVDDYCPVYTFASKELADKYEAYLNYSGISAGESANDDGTTTVLVREKDVKKAKKHFNAFYSVEMQNSFADEMDELAEVTDKKQQSALEWIRNSEMDTSDILTPDDFTSVDEEFSEAIDEIVPAEPYEKRSDKAKDVFSTAIIFFAFGGLGFLLVLLSLFKVVTIFSGPFFLIFATLLFAGFIVVGVVSYRSYLKYKSEAEQEDQVTEAILGWLKENFTKEDYNKYKKEFTDRIENSTPEERYFYISSKIKALIASRFGELDEAYLDYITEDFYTNNLQ